jgi:hypothetical protein
MQEDSFANHANLREWKNQENRLGMEKKRSRVLPKIPDSRPFA